MSALPAAPAERCPSRPWAPSVSIITSAPQGATVGNELSSLPAGSTVDFDVPPSTAGGAGNAALTGAVTLGAGATWNLTGGASATNTAYTVGGTATAVLAGNATINVQNNGTGVGTLVLGGVNDNGGGFVLTKNGLGNLTISGSSNYSGGLVVNGGIVTAGQSSALGTGAVTLNSGVLSFATGAPSSTGFSGFITNGGATLDPTNSMVTLTDNNGGEGRSIFSPAQVSIANGFTASYIYTASGNRSADGVAFVIQNSAAGSNALGSTGGGLGYGGTTTGSTTGGIPNSAALRIQSLHRE